MEKISIQKISLGGWNKCIRLTNGIIDLVITTDVGPRIIRYGFINQENELCIVESTMDLAGGNEWRIYGGHRLWHSPEAKPRTYEPDNSPVTWEEIPDGIKTTQDVEPLSRIRKEMEITISSDTSTVRILHRLINLNPWSIELSAWGISAMATGGKEIIPQTQRDTGLLPNRLMVLWPYARLNDSRLHFGEKYIILQQKPDIKQPFKLGIPNEDGWAAYFNHNHLFVKHHAHNRNAQYPDFGASYETYINDSMLEMETLSPLTLLKPEAAIEHLEEWELFDNISMPSNDEAEIEEIIRRFHG